MPKTCEFVYQVESDIQLAISISPQILGAPYSTTPHYLRVQTSFVDAYTDDNGVQRRGLEPQSQLTELSLTPNSRSASFNLTLLSFEANIRKLYRSIDFSFEALDEQQQVLWRLPEDPAYVYTSEFGRQFGELCHPEGREMTPWVERSVGEIAL